ncbi:nesprin-2 isoform X12 [Brienomyrus brachyistius]|uniref:nesprin-2 isoform X12 n=1 Tax=Brienomyrus brachyistius TaxID=42636 RepID=UPI0020B44283|nr:nesprin-2 isoform X12 [Brienomyrus brachyistius]
MPSEVSTLEAELTADEGRLQAEIPKTEATVAFDTELTESVIEVADVDAMADRDMLQVDLPKSDSDVTEGQSRTQTVIKISEVCFTLQMDTMQDEIATAEVTVTSGSEVVEPEICRPSTESERVEFEIAKAEPEVTLDIVTLKPSIAKIEPDLRPDTDGLQTEQLKVKIDLSSDIDRVTPEKSETDTDVTPERETLLSDIPSPKADVVSGSKRKLSITGIQCFTIEDTDTAVTGIQRLKTEDTYTVLTGIQSVKIEETDTAVTGIAHLIIEDSETVITGIQSLKSEDTHIAVTGIHSLKIEDTDTADTGVRILQIEDTDTADTGVRILQTEDTNTAVTGIHSLKIEDTDTAVTGVRILQIEDTDAAVTGVRILQIEDTDTAVTGVRSLKTVDTDTVATGIQSLKTEDTDTAVTGTISSEKLDNEIAVKEKYLSYQQDSEMPKPDFTTYVEEVAREPRVEVHGESTETLQEVLLVSRNVHWPTTVQSVEHVESLSTATLLTDDPSVSISSQPRKTHAEQMDSDILPTQPLGTWTSIHSMTQHIISESADSDSSSLGPGLPQSRPWDLRHRVAHLSSLQPPDPDAQEDTGSGSSSLPTATLKTGHTKSQKGVNQGSSCVPQQWERRGGDLVTGPAEARSGVESGAESASQPTMTELLMDCLQLERQEASSSIKGRSPLWDAMVCIDTSPRNQENHLILSRVAFRILCCQNQPARISTTAMVQQVDEAKACQQCVLEKLDALPSAGIALETVHPTERQWKAILQDASAAVQMKEAQMQLVSQYEEKRQTAEGALAKLKVELKAACGDTTECMTLQEEQLRGFLQNLEQESSTMAAVLQVFPQVSPVLDEDDRTGTLIQLEDLQGHWWTLQRVAERALYHATAYVQESATLLREAQDLHKQLKALQASELFQSRSGNCASVQLVFFGATLAATEYQYDKLNQLFEALNQSLAGETERRDIRLALQSLKEGLDLVKTQLSEMSISVISDALSKIMKVMQDHLTWAKKMEIKITEKMRKLDLFPEKVHRQIFELKKLKCEIQSKQIQLESLVEDVKELTPVLDEKELPPLLSLVDTLKDLTKSAADNSVRALLDVKLSLQMKEKLFEQITNVDAWVAKHVEKEMTSWANQPDSEPGIASRLRHRMAELKEAEKHSAVIMTLLNKAGEMAPQLSLADRCKLHDLLIDHQGTIHGIITSERKGCRELEDLRQARVSSLETLASIEAGLRQIDLDLTKHKFPVTKDSLTILEHYRYLLLKHRWQVERLHHCKRDKRRELQRVMVDLQKKINSLGLQAEAHGKYLSSKKQMEDWRQNLEKQALQLKDEKISKVERFRSCHILSVQFSLTKNICQEVTNQLNNISQDLYPSQLNSERQKIRHTMQGLASWEMAIHNDLKILESALLEGKCYFAELHAMLEFLRDAQHKLDHALPVSPDEQAIDRELLWCLSIEKRAESGKRALEALKYRTGTRQDKLESKHSELTDLIEKVLKESHLRTGSLHQAKEALRVYSAAVCGAADFFQDAESQLLPVLSETSGCADELQCLTAASASLTQGFGHLLSRLQELLPLRTCLSVSQVEQIHMCVMSHLLVTLAMLQARAQLQHEALQSCTKRQNLYRKSLDDICHHVEHLEKSLSECVSHKVTSLQECSDLQEKLKALEQEAESHSRALRGTLTDLWLHCPKPGCGSKDEAEAVTLRRRLAGLHHSACDLRGCWERRAAEWKGIALSMEGAQKVREQLEDEIPPSPREGALQEELQNLLPDTEKYLESLNSELCVLASLEMRLPRTLGDPAKKEQATPSQFSQDLQAIRESYRKLTEKSMLGRQAASVELHDREKVREEIYGMRERLRVASCRLASLEHFACQSRLQEVRLELSSQRAVLRGIMEGLRVKYPSSFPLVPLEVQKPLQEVTHLLEELEEKLAETAEKISPVRRLGVGVTQVTGGLRLVMSLLEQKSSTVVEAEYLQKRVWDELDRWHTQLAALESEVADMSQDQPELAHNLMDQLTEPLQLYQKVVKQAEQRTAFLSKIPACLQEYEEIMASSNSWLREAKGWLNTPCSYTSARSLSSHVHALQVLLEDSEQMRATLQAFTPFLKEISTVCNTMALEQRLNQADEHVASMQQSIVGPLTQLQNTAAGVDAIEAEVKFMEKNVTKIRAILSSLDSESASPEEHLRDWQVILDNIQAMKRTITEIQNCKPSLGLPREAEEALDVFQRAQDLLPPIQDLEQETVTQIATIKISASYELKYMRKIRSIADDAVDPRGIICAVEGKVWETSLSEEEEEGSTHSSSSDTLIGSVSEGPDDTAEEPAFPAEGTMGAAGGGGAQHGDLVVGAACGGVDFGDGLNVGVLETPEPHLIPTTKSAIAWKEEDRFPEPIIKQIFDPHDKYMFRSSTPSSEILKDDHQAEVMGDVFGPPLSVSASLETDYDSQLSATIPRENVSVSQEALSLLYKRNLSLPEETKSVRQHTVSVPQRDVSAPAKTTSVTNDTASVPLCVVSISEETLSVILETVSVPKRDVPAPKETTSVTRDTASVPTRDVSAPKETVSAAKDMLSVPQKDDLASAEYKSVTQETVSVPDMNESAPKETTPVTQETVSVCQTDAVPLRADTSFTQETVSVHKKDVAATAETISVTHDALSVAKRDMSTSKKTISVTEEKMSVPNKDVTATKETILVTQETMSVPKRDVSTPKKTLSAIQETVSVLKMDVSAPKASASVTRETVSIHEKDVSDLTETISVALDTMSVLQKDMSTPAKTISETLETVSVPKRDVTATKETISVTQETVSIPKRHVKATKETVSSPQDTLSIPQKDVSATAKSISVAPDTMSVLQKDVSPLAETISETQETVSVPKRDVTATKETISVTQETVSIPKRDVSAPKETVSSPEEILSVPQKDVSARKETTSVTQDTVSIPKRDVSAPKETVSAPQEMLSVPQKDVSDPTETISVALDTMSVLQKDVSTPAETISETLETVSVPKRDVSATKETISVTQETVSAPKRDVKATKETISVTQETVSIPKRDVKATKETISVTQETVSAPKRDVSAPKETASAAQDTLSIPQKDVSAPAKSISVALDTMSVLQKDVSAPAETISETLETVSVPKRDVTATKETTSVTQETVSIPKRDVSAPKETVSAPQEMLSVPQKDVSARKETISVTRDTVSIPKRDVSAPKETVSAPQEMLSVPQKDVSAPAKSISVALDTMSVLQKDVSPPAETISETLETVSVPKRDVTATKETTSVTQETVSIPKRDVSAPKETVSAPQEMLSVPQKDVSARKETISVTRDTVSIPKRDVSAPKETVSAPQEMLSLPEKDVSAPAKSISAPHDTLSIPQEDVSTPAETISETLETVSVPKRDVTATKETTSVTQETVSIPKRDVSAPKETVSAPQEMLSVPQKDVSARKETISVTRDTVSIPKRDVSAPKETVSAPQEMLSLPEKDVSAPAKSISAPHDTLSIPQEDVSTPAETISETLETVSVPKRDVTATKETISVTQETVSVPKRDVSAPKETVSAPQEMLSLPEKDVSAPAKSISVALDTMSVLQKDVSTPAKTISETLETVSVPKRDVSSPKETVSATQEKVSVPKRDVSARKVTVSAPQDTLSIPQEDVPTPTETILETLETVSVPKRDVKATKETISVTQETVSVPKRDVSAPKETISAIQETVSVPKRDVSAPKETTSVTQETVLIHQKDVSAPTEPMSVMHDALSVAKRDMSTSKETISVTEERMSFPMMDMSATKETISVTQETIPAPNETVRAPQEMLSVPQKDVSSRKETTPVIRDTVSVPKRDVSAPTKTTSITQETVSVRQNDVLAPTESISITHDALSTAKRDVSTPKETVSVTEETLSVPKRDVSATKETTPVTQDTASVPKRDVSAPNESTSVTQDTMSVAQKDLSAPVDNISVTRDTVSLPNRDVPATKDTPSATQDIVSVTKETTSITQETVSGPQGDVSSPAKTMSVTHHTLTLVKRDEFATKETISEPKETVSVPHKDASVPFQTVPLGQQSVGIPLEPLAVPPMHVPVSGGPWVEQGLQPLCDLTTQVRAWLESAHGSLSDMLPGAPMPGGIEEQLLTCQGACEEMEKNVSSLYSLSPQDLAETRRWIVTLLSALDQLKSSLLPLLQLSEHSCQIQSDLQCGVLVQEGGLEHTVSNPELLTTLKIQSIQQEKELQLELKEQRDLAVALQHYSSQGWLQRATQEHKAQLLTRSNTGAEGDATAQERRPQVHGQLEATLAALDGTGSTWQDVLASGNAGKPVTWSMPAILRREAIQLEDLLNTACTSLQSQQGALQEQLDQQLQYEQRLHGLASLVELGWERLTRSQHVQLRSQDELQGLLSSHKTFFQKLASHLAMVQRLSQRLSATGLQTQAGAQTEAQAEAQAALEQDARTLQQRAVQQGVRLQDGLQAWSQWQESCGWIAKLLHDLEARMPSSTGPGHEDQEEQLQQTLCVCEQVSKALEESRAPLGAAVEQGQALQAGGFGSTVGAALRELQSRWNAVHHCAEREQLRVSAFTHLWARFCSDSVALGDWLGRARERLESWRRRCDATPPQQEHVRQRLANFLDFTKEVEARSSLKASVISTGEQLLQLKRCGDAGTLREQLTQLEQGWAEILSTLPSVQDWLHQQLMEKLHPSEAMTELGVWMDAMEKRLKEDHQEIRQASSAAGLQPLLQRYKEYQVEMACHQLTVDTLDQSVSQPSGIDLPATRYELALHAEKLGALNLRWLRLKGALCSQVQLLEQNLQTCLARDERLRVLGGGLSRQREKLSQVERPSSRSQAREALQECGDTEEKLKDTEAQLQELREVCLSDTDGELRRHCTCSEQLDMLRRDCADLRQQVTALRPRLQGALDLWGLVTKGLAEIALHTTKSQYSLEQGTHAQFSQHALQDHVDELQLLQVEAGGAEEKWEALNQNFSNLRDVISPAAAQLLSEQIEKQKIRWAAVSQEVAGALPRAQELLGLWRRFSGAFMSCSQSLQVHQERASFLLAAWPGRQHTAEQVVKRLEASRMQQQSLQVLQRSMEEVMETSKHLTGHMNVPASIFIQSEGWMLSCELLKLREALARREGHLQEELQELQKFTSSLASLELHLCSCQSRLTSGADSAPQSVLQDLGSLGPELEALNWKGDMLPQGDPAGDRLQALNRQWSVTFSQAAQVYSELQQGAVGQQSFQLLCQGWEAFLQSMEDSLARQEPLCSPSLREQLAVLQKLRVELPRGDQLLWSVLREGQGLLESLEAEQRHDLALQLTHMREHWHSVLVRVQQHGALLRALVRYWQLYIHGTNELRALLSQTDTLLPPTGPAHCSLRELRWSLHDLKYAEDQVGHRRAVYRQTMQIGWQLCSASDAQTQAQLQTELRLLQEDWERTESLLEKRRALTEAVLQNWERYKARLADSGERLEEVRNRLKQPLPECLEEIRVTEKITKEQEEALQHWAHDLTELAAMKTELSQYVTGKDGGPPDEAAEDLQLQWEELCAKVSLRKQEIADRLSAWVIFNKKNRELCEWLTQMESKVTHRADISLDDMMEKLKKDFMEEINLFSENKIHLNRLAEQLLSASDQAQGAEASDRMADVNARWQCLLDHIEARVRKLKETRSTVRQLDMDMNPLRVWLCRTEATLATPVTYSICHQDEIQGKLAEQQDLQRDVEQHAESVASMLTVCEGLLGDSEGCGTETERKSLQETARCLEQRWRNICTRALERRARIDGTWQLWCSFLDDHSHFDSWLKAAEHTAANPESANVPYASAKEELKKFEAFQRQVQERLAQLERLNKQYCQLAREHRTDSADRLRHMAWEVNRRWDELESRVAAILRRLRHFTSQREEFEGMREGLLVWLTEMDLQLTTVEHFSESDVQDKMRQLNDFQQEITLNTSKIDQLIVFGENLIQKSAAPDAVAIEDELEELHSYCQEVFGRVGRFHQRLTSLQQVVQEQQHQQEDLEEEARPARGGGLLSISQERSDRDTPVSVESIPLEWDHAVDVGPHQRKGEEEEEEEEEATFYSALSGRSETEASWHSPEHTETGGPYPDVIHTQASGPLDTSVPLKEGYVDLMLECSGTVASVERVSLILNSPEHPDDVGLTGISAADKQSGVIKRWELLQAQARGVELEAGRDLRGQQLTSDLEGVAAWLGQVQCELERLKSKPSASVQDMEAHVRQLKEMQHSFASYKTMIISANLRARELQQSEAVAARDLQGALCSVNQGWKEACAGLEAWEEDLRSALLWCQEFHTTLHSLLLWLAHAESRRFAVDMQDPSLSQAALLEQQANLRGLEAELLSRQQQVESLQEISSQLLPEAAMAEEEYAEAREKVHVVGRKLHTLLQLVDGDLHVLQERLVSCPPPESAADVVPGEQGEVQEVKLAAEGTPPEATSRRQAREQSPPRSFFQRVLRATFPLHVLFLLLLVLACLVYPFPQLRSFHPMLHYTNGPPPT